MTIGRSGRGWSWEPSRLLAGGGESSQCGSEQGDARAGVPFVDAPFVRVHGAPSLPGAGARESHARGSPARARGSRIVVKHATWLGRCREESGRHHEQGLRGVVRRQEVGGEPRGSGLVPLGRGGSVRLDRRGGRGL